jgi:hypothetical protein
MFMRLLNVLLSVEFLTFLLLHDKLNGSIAVFKYHIMHYY